MNIALIGYGKMGKAIEVLATERQHNIIACIDKDSFSDLEKLQTNKVDVAIEFTQPSSAYTCISTCLKKGIPVVSGTTAWNEKSDSFEHILKICKDSETAFLHAPNFSLGVQLFFLVNKYLAKLMANQTDYAVSLEEIHHIQKKDSPSGTAVEIAKQILNLNTYLKNWALEEDSESSTKNTILPIKALRKKNIPGTHTISYESEIDKIELKHTAFNRKGFALGALMVAEWIISKKGIFTIEDYLKELLNLKY